jgi:hypothetical protein
MMSTLRQSFRVFIVFRSQIAVQIQKPNCLNSESNKKIRFRSIPVNLTPDELKMRKGSDLDIAGRRRQDEGAEVDGEPRRGYGEISVPLVRIEFGGPQICDVKLFTNTPQADFVGQGVVSDGRAAAHRGQDGDREDPKGVLRAAAHSFFHPRQSDAR